MNVNCWKRSKISVACIIVYPNLCNKISFLLAVLLVHMSGHLWRFLNCLKLQNLYFFFYFFFFFFIFFFFTKISKLKVVIIDQKTLWTMYNFKENAFSNFHYHNKST